MTKICQSSEPDPVAEGGSKSYGQQATTIAQSTTNLEATLHEQQARTEDEKAITYAIKDAERLTLALEAAKMGWWDLDWTTRQTLWSPRHEILFGYEPGQPERDYFDWERRIHPDDLEWIHQATHYARDHHQDLAIQYRIIWPDGSLHWIDTLGRFYYDSQGEPIRMVGVIRDITDQKHSEEALQDSEERFRATFEQAAVGIAHVDLEGRWLRVNQTLCNIVGYSEAELLERRFQDITHPDDLETDLGYVQQLLAGEIQTYSMEKRYLHKEGFPVWIELTVSLARHRQADQDGSLAILGEPKYFISVVEEISDRKRCERGRDEAEVALQARARELAEANLLLTQAATLINLRNQELDQFVHVVSHDLKAPLRAIANLSEWIETDLAGQLPAENEQQLQLLRTRVQRMTTMIDDLLTYSRIGRVAGTTEAVDVAEFLAEIIDTLDPPPTFTIEIESPMPILQTKRLPLSQVFANLISNAIKHRDRPQGHIHISSREQAEFYEFALRDDGPGIAPEHHDHIFTIFQALKPNQESTGIGLSIVKKIVETEGGMIRLESQVGEGAAFYFTWPRNGG